MRSGGNGMGGRGPAQCKKKKKFCCTVQSGKGIFLVWHQNKKQKNAGHYGTDIFHYTVFLAPLNSR
jgi:hypothetical protein